jgi:sugar phosphate isomerase/epimerase
MIDQVFAAPKHAELDEGLCFALENQLGFEIPSFYDAKNLENSEPEIARYTGLLSSHRAPLSMHGPIIDMNVVSLDPKVLEASRLRYKQAIDIAKQLNVRYLIFHSQWSPIYPAIENGVEQWTDALVEYWQSIVEEELQDGNLTILIENFLDPNPESMLRLLQRVSSPHLKACLDTGHVNIFSTLSPIDWVRELNRYIVYIHAHNNDGQIDSHEAFDSGILDMSGFLNHVALLPQKIHLAIETSSLAALESSFKMTQPYLTLQHEQYASKSFLI